MIGRRSVVALCLCFALCLLQGASAVLAFAEEDLGFRDPATGVTYAPDEGHPEISTVHTDLTYALALAAGFTEDDAATLMVYNQLVDSEVLPGGTVSYTNCVGALAASPDPRALYPGCGLNCAKQIWPMWDSMADPATCATSRFGPLSPFFHFPHRTGPLAERDLGALRAWATGASPELVAYEAYAWGRVTDLSVVQARYRYTRTVTVTTGISAGSLPAFATYLHALADSYSHEACITEMDAAGLEWATHTLDDTYPACQYNPANPQDDDAHGVEFGSYAEAQRTIDAAGDMYAQLTERSVQRDGRTWPLDLGTPLMLDGTPTTLAGAIEAFVRAWPYSQPANRRAYVDRLAEAVLALPRDEIHRAAVPLVVR